MRIKVLFVTMLAALAFASCEKKFTIKGTLANGSGQTLYIEELSPDGPIFLDSIRLDSKGNFSFSYTMPYQTFYNLHASADNYVVLLPENGEKISLSGDYEDLAMTYQVDGSHGSNLMWKLQDYTNDGVRCLREIAILDKARRDSVEAGLLSAAQYDAAHRITDSIYLAAYMSQQDYIMHFIEENRGSLSTLIAVYKPFNGHPIIDPQYMVETYEEVAAGLRELMPDNPHTIHFENEVARLRYQYGSQQPQQGIQITQP